MDNKVKAYSKCHLKLKKKQKKHCLYLLMKTCQRFHSDSSVDNNNTIGLFDLSMAWKKPLENTEGPMDYSEKLAK